MISEEELQAIEARANAATMDPWLPGALTVTESITAARTDIPALVAEVWRLREAMYQAWLMGYELARNRSFDHAQNESEFDQHLVSDVQTLINKYVMDAQSTSG
jgi:hypothetical protein